MEPEGSLPHSQAPATYHYPEPQRTPKNKFLYTVKNVPRFTEHGD